MLAALAASTERIQLGPLVAATSFRAPALLAKMAATVDEISGGRLILGLGAGWNETEYRAFGFPFDQRVARFEEAFTIIRTLLREGRIDFEGRFYSARDCELLPRGPRPGGPPLMIGSIGARMLRITAPYVDAWNAWHDWFGNSPAGLPPLLESVAQAEAAAGRPQGSIERTVTALVAFPGGVGRDGGDPEAVAAWRRSAAIPRPSPSDFVTMPPWASATSSWCSTPSRSARSRRSRRCWRASTRAEPRPAHRLGLIAMK